MRVNPGKKNNKIKKQKNTKVLLFLWLFLLALSFSILFGLNRTRKELIEECENTLLWEVQLSAREVSEDIENKFAAMDTIQEMVTRAGEIGPETIELLAASKDRYK